MRTERRARGWLLVAALALLALALLTQQALAAQLGRWVAGAWVAIMEIILRLIAPLLGG